VRSGESRSGIRVDAENRVVISKGLQWVIAIALAIFLALVGFGGTAYWRMADAVSKLQNELAGTTGKLEGAEPFLWDRNRQADYVDKHREKHEAENAILLARLENIQASQAQLQAQVEQLRRIVEDSQ
jgi:hypothetical protein